MSLFSDTDIRLALELGQIAISPYNHDQLQPASYNLSLAPGIKIWQSQATDLLLSLDPRHDNSASMFDYIMPEYGYHLGAGQSILGSTAEWIGLGDDMVARLEGRSSLARLMLLVHVSAGYVDPGWKGRLTFEIVNLSPRTIIIYPGMQIAQLAFEQTKSKATRPYGHKDLHSKYQNSEGTVSSRIHLDPHRREMDWDEASDVNIPLGGPPLHLND